MKFRKLLFILVFLGFFTSIVFAGTLSQTIYSPFNHIVEEEKTEYHSGLSSEATQTFVDDRYKDFSEYSDDDVREPFCRIGGQYMINVFNDPSPGAGSSNSTYKLYYCKTTRDLLQLINIPSSWKDNDLLVYCNDGKNVHSLSTNFDYITTLLNTYKACIVRNLDLDDDNVIVYGLEVGNRIVDNSPEYFYNDSTGTGPVLLGFSKVNETLKSWIAKEEYGGKSLVPYIKETWQEEVLDKKTNKKVKVTKCKWRPRSNEEALNWTITNHDDRAEKMILKRNHIKPVDGGCEGNAGSKSFSEYLYKLDVDYKSANIDFKYKDDRVFNFDYDQGEHFYALSDFYINLNGGSEVIPLLDIFPFGNDIELSRVALFKKQGKKFIYGYESSVNLLTEIFGPSVLPTYIVKLVDFDGFNSDSCVSSLGSFDVTKSGIDERSQVVCDGNQIKIVSNNVNTNDKGYEAFHLFKNVVLGLE